jgi:hypothetical protein
MTTLRIARWILAGAVPVALACIGTAAEPPQGPIPKGRIEQPLKNVVAQAAPATAPAVVASADNPTVEAGLVKWHKTVEDAQAAAKKSGKPVLLFQMMGYLDKKFC